MTAFRFRMDPILRLRATQLEACRADLEKERLRCEHLEKLADAADEKVRSAADALQASLSVGTTGARVRWAGNAQANLHASAVGFAASAKKSEASVDDARERLLEAWRRTRSLEILRQRSVTLWKRESEKREQRAADEVAARQWFR